MAVMTHMRERATIILFILLVLFVLSMTVGGLVGGANIMDILTGKHPDAVGIVNGKEIPIKYFEETFNRQLDQYRRQSNTEITDSQISFLRNQVWESMVRDILVQEAIDDAGIKADNSEIVYRLFNDPPEILKTNPAFLNEQKQFDMARYQAAINDPNTGPQWRPIEEYLKQSIPFDKFQQRLQATVRITDEEIKREYLKQNQKAKVKYLFINPRQVNSEDIEVTDEMINNYYNTHKDDYLQEEQRAIEYVTFSTVATAQDSADVYDLAESLKERVKEGEDFADLAEVYSEDPGSKDNGGDLGYFGKGAMVKEFEEAAFNAKVGELVGPVKSNFGLHVIQVNDKRKQKGETEVKASHILLKFSASKNTVDLARENADYLSNQAKSKDFAEVVTELEDSVETTGLFVKGSGFIPGIGLNQRVSNFVFNRKVGDISPVMEINNGFIVFRISEVKKESIKPLESVKTLITNTLQNEMRMTKAGELARQVYENIQNGTTFETAAQKDSLQIGEPPAFKRAGSVDGVGRDVRFIGAAFGLNETNPISKPVEGTRGYYIIQLLEKDSLDEAGFASSKAQIAAQIKQRKQSQAFASWYAKVKDEADIKDYRDRFYF